MLVSNREGKGKFHSNISNLLSCLLPAMIEQASHGPYPITTKSSIFHSPPPTADLEVREKKQSLKKRGKKMSAGGSLEMLDTGGSLMHHTHVPQWGRGNTPDGKSKAVGEKRLKRSRSTDGCFSLFPAGFRLPDQVMIFQVLEKLEEGVAQWDFYLLTEEEVRKRGGVIWVRCSHPFIWDFGHFDLCTLPLSLYNLYSVHGPEVTSP